MNKSIHVKRILAKNIWIFPGWQIYIYQKKIHLQLFNIDVSIGVNTYKKKLKPGIQEGMYVEPENFLNMHILLFKEIFQHSIPLSENIFVYQRHIT